MTPTVPELVAPCRARAVHATSSGRRYELVRRTPAGAWHRPRADGPLVPESCAFAALASIVTEGDRDEGTRLRGTRPQELDRRPRTHRPAPRGRDRQDGRHDHLWH